MSKSYASKDSLLGNDQKFLPLVVAKHGIMEPLCSWILLLTSLQSLSSSGTMYSSHFELVLSFEQNRDKKITCIEFRVEFFVHIAWRRKGRPRIYVQKPLWSSGNEIIASGATERPVDVSKALLCAADKHGAKRWKSKAAFAFDIKLDHGFYYYYNISFKLYAFNESNGCMNAKAWQF